MNFIPKKECVYLIPADDQAMVDLAGGQPNTGTRFVTIAVGEECDASICEMGRVVYLASFDVRHVTQFADGWIVHHSAILVAEEYQEPGASSGAEVPAAEAAVLSRITEQDIPAPQPQPMVPQSRPATPALAPVAAPQPPQVSRPVAASSTPPVSRPVQPAAAPAPSMAPPTGPGPGTPAGQQADTGVTTHVTAGPDPKPRTATPPRRAPGTPRRAPQPPRQ